MSLRMSKVDTRRRKQGEVCSYAVRAEMSPRMSHQNVCTEAQDQASGTQDQASGTQERADMCSDDPLMRRHVDGAGNCVTTFGVRRLSCNV